jgi:hypothetical protein
VEVVDAAIVLDQLDVVGAFSNAGVDESLGVLGRRKRRDGQAVFCSVSTWSSNQRARRSQVGAVDPESRLLFSSHGGGQRLQSEHVEVGTHTEGQRCFQVRRRLDVRVGSISAGSRHMPAASITSEPVGAVRLDPTASILEPTIKTLDGGSIRTPSKTRAF